MSAINTFQRFKKLVFILTNKRFRVFYSQSGHAGRCWEAVDALNGLEIAQMEFRESFWMITSLYMEYMEPQHQLTRAPHLWNRIREDIEILITQVDEEIEKTSRETGVEKSDESPTC